MYAFKLIANLGGPGIGGLHHAGLSVALTASSGTEKTISSRESSGTTIRSRISVHITVKGARKFFNGGEIRPKGSCMSPSELSWAYKKTEWRDISSVFLVSVCTFFPLIEDFEQGKDTEIQGLVDVACMPHESDKNNSLGTGIGATRRVI
jgi:hypothetical protein